jgi:putative endonuclease
MQQYYVYIMTNRSRTLYTGVTNDLERRVAEHKEGRGCAFTRKYRINRLAYYEAFPTALEAIAAEKTIKGWVREKKISLIESMNPKWLDLSVATGERSDLVSFSSPEV